MAKKKSKGCYSSPYSSREIYQDGKPFIQIHRVEGTQFMPTEVDSVAKKILKLLNKGKKSC